ncbi:hypothetical protein [Streptomyces microflavus]|uniref:hypothetical protein n=1 Tax=Streptomyces microflavus TaxID=1919 RepID=UPI003B2208E3
MASVDLFAGPGGIDLADRAIGIEWDANAVATRVAAGLPTVHGDVRDYGPADFPEATRLTGGPRARRSPSLAPGPGEPL